MTQSIKRLPLDELEAAGLKVSGEQSALLKLQNAIEIPPPNYPIVTP